ncbi:MAG: hypothetical protein Q9226_009201 [Calogaya cf. arnoldii]
MVRGTSSQRQKEKGVPEDYQACAFPFTRDYGMAPRRLPSSAGLPDRWSEEMDRFICFSDAVGETPTRMVILSLKKRFPELNQFALSELAIERRIYCLDRMENNYFKKGAHIAVQRLESAGITLPPPDYGSDEDMTRIRESDNVPFTSIRAAMNGLLTEVPDEPGRFSHVRGNPNHSDWRNSHGQQCQQ